MEPADVAIRGFSPPDAAFIRSLIARQGWNGGLHDPETFAAADPDAWLIAELDGEPVGVTLATRWNDAFGWIGVYLVDPDLRARGIGLALFRRALECLQPRSVGLDGDPAQQANYRRSGFVDVHPNTRWHGPAGAWEAAGEVVPAAELAFDDLVALDARAVGAERRALLRAWLDQPEAVSVAVVDGRVTGFATARPASDGWKVGPVHASDAATASAVIAGAVADLAPDTVCWLDAPDPNGEARELFSSHGYEASPTSGRMTRGEAPPADVSISFALTAHEVG
jgi:GNAT superfamily N-acetyltransferase